MKNELKVLSQDLFVLRAPFLQITDWENYRANVQKAKEAQGKNRWHVRAAVARTYFERPDINEAIFLASPGLHARLSSLNLDSQSDTSKKLLLAFERYLNRMCFRSTPFGKFATFSSGKLTDSPDSKINRVDYGGDGTGTRKVRVDAGYLVSLSAMVSELYRHELRYSSNCSAHVQGELIKFIDWVEQENGSRAYSCTSVSAHLIVSSVIESFASLPQMPKDVFTVISNQYPDITEEVFDCLIEDLIEAKLLLPNIYVDLFAKDAASNLAKKIIGIPSARSIGVDLFDIVCLLEKLSNVEIGIVEKYRNVESRLRALNKGYTSGPVLRVDTFRTNRNYVLSNQIADNLLTELSLLMSKFGERDCTLDNFCSQFERHYGRSMVPLLEVLEHENMFAAQETIYSHEMLREFRIFGRMAAHNRASLRNFDKLLIDKLIKSGVSNLPIRITSEEIKKFASIDGDFPPHMFAILTRLPEGTLETNEPTVWLQGLSNSSIGSWTGRFCYGDENLTKYLRDTALSVEHENTSIIHAEISYLPSANLCNVLTRPLIWKHRINFTAADEYSEDEIPLADILVSVKNGRVQIWSRKLRKQIIPHMTSAHSVQHPGNIKAYTFLRSLEMHGKIFSNFRWGAFFSEYDFLPRLEFGKIVLAPARWLVQLNKISNFEFGDVFQRITALKKYLHEQGVPPIVELKENDNTLVIDCNDDMDMEQLYRSILKNNRLVLREILGQNNSEFSRHELLLPMQVIFDSRADELNRHENLWPDDFNCEEPIRRDLRCAPLNEVLYAKIYLNDIDAENFLTNTCAPFICHVRKLGYIDNWFFIRYEDPDQHIRLRLFTKDVSIFGNLFSEFVKLLDSARDGFLIQRYEILQYEREIVRYGGADLVRLNEALFFQDSEIVINVISDEFISGNNKNKFKAAIWAANALLCDFRLSFFEKHKIVERMAKSYRSEFFISKYQLQQFSIQFRENSGEFFSIALHTSDRPDWCDKFDLQTQVTRAWRQSTCAIIKDNTAEMPGNAVFDGIVQSQLHMLSNRFFGPYTRQYEVIIYDTLERMYRGALGQTSNLNKLSEIKKESLTLVS